jgi:hypothetical protein
MLEFRKPGASSFPIVYRLTIDSHSSDLFPWKGEGERERGKREEVLKSAQ